MKERPVIFIAPMVRAILEGRKTQTRRVIKDTGFYAIDSAIHGDEVAMRERAAFATRCPFGQAGDRLWVREAFMHEPADYCWEASVSIPCRPAVTVYRADADPTGEARGIGWKPSIFMPRQLSRIDLTITGVRVEKLQDISEADSIAEGVDRSPCVRHDDDAAAFHRIGPVNNDSFPIARYAVLWESINGVGSWDANPWVWVIGFRRIDTKGDQK